MDGADDGVVGATMGPCRLVGGHSWGTLTWHCWGSRHVGVNYFSDSDHQGKIGRNSHSSPWGNPKFSLYFSGV